MNALAFNYKIDLPNEAENLSKEETKEAREKRLQAVDLGHYAIAPEWYGYTWFVVGVKGGPRVPRDPHHDQKLAYELRKLGMPFIMPVGYHKQRNRDRNGKRLRTYSNKPRLLVPKYVLVGVGPLGVTPRLDEARKCRWFAGVVGAGGFGMSIDQAGFKKFANALNGGAYGESGRGKRSQLADSLPKVGDLATILDGAFAGIDCVVDKVRNENKGEEADISRAFVRLHVFGREISAELDIDSLKIIEVAN